jgi:phage shock protein PspC (stress-responsive transcriptional regulator)
MQKVLSKEFTRNFPKVYNDMMKGLCDGINKVFGVDTTSWKTLNIYVTVSKIISKANRRVILGEALCKDEVSVYLSHSRVYQMIWNHVGFLGADTTTATPTNIWNASCTSSEIPQVVVDTPSAPSVQRSSRASTQDRNPRR